MLITWEWKKLLGCKISYLLTNFIRNHKRVCWYICETFNFPHFYQCVVEQKRHYINISNGKVSIISWFSSRIYSFKGNSSSMYQIFIICMETFPNRFSIMDHFSTVNRWKYSLKKKRTPRGTQLGLRTQPHQKTPDDTSDEWGCAVNNAPKLVMGQPNNR